MLQIQIRKCLPYRRSKARSLPRVWGGWEIGGFRQSLGSGYQRTNEWASVLGIVTGLRIINSHELMCTAAAAAAAEAATTRCRCLKEVGILAGPVSQSSFYKLKLKLLCLSWGEINICCCCCCSLSSFLASLYLPPLATNYTQLEKLPSPHHPFLPEKSIGEKNIYMYV